MGRVGTLPTGAKNWPKADGRCPSRYALYSTVSFTSASDLGGFIAGASAVGRRSAAIIARQRIHSVPRDHAPALARRGSSGSVRRLMVPSLLARSSPASPPSIARYARS